MNSEHPSPTWPRKWLVAAGVYNLVWGALVVGFPSLLFDLASMEPPRYPQIWQCVGMIVGVYGIGYLVAASHHRRHWPIILVGLLGKVFGPLGFLYALMTGQLPIAFGATILTNDLVWWVPFTMMLWDAARAHGNYDSQPQVSLDTALDSLHDQKGQSLRSLAEPSPLLLVVLRHTGCTFCKETVRDLKTQRKAIEDRGVRIAVVAMSPTDELVRFASHYGLEDLSWISDPERLTYRSLELRRGRFVELFGPVVWVRGLIATFAGHLPGKLAGDGFQMPGSFVLHQGRVIQAHRHRHAGERVDHVAMVCELPV